jgi:hypothetical protein
LATVSAPGFFEARARQDQHAWRRGAQGEESLAAELWRIARPGQWRYLHSVPVGSRGADIDHVLVGPAGVFTIKVLDPNQVDAIFGVARRSGTWACSTNTSCSGR